MQLPTSEQIRLAFEIYLKHAYAGPPPEAVQLLLPEPGVEPAACLVGPTAECDPPGATLETLRSAAFRLGNFAYPHMKLRVSRPPNRSVFLFSVDAHDAILQARPGTPDYAMLQELKAHNAKLAEAIHAAWDAAGLPTERSYLRGIVEKAKSKRDDSAEKSQGSGE
ncbi:MAG: hypothetical protein JW849_11305 [Phycisphaerae bacterium]|nr:hypothetical protein [Phycisphaerae bacterium]